MSPEEFLEGVKKLEHGMWWDRFEERMKGGDPEARHGDTDKLMEELLIELGYGEGVARIREHDRWYG